MKIALRHNGKYLAAENRPVGRLHWNRTSIGPWETWAVEAGDDRRIALKSHHGHYLSAEGGGGGIVVADRAQIGPWEQFRPSGTLLGAHAALESWDGRHYVTVSGTDEVSATSTTPQAFDIEIVDGGPTPGQLLPRLRVQGINFVGDDTGRRLFLKGASAFMLYRDFLDGRDVEPFLNTLRNLSANCVRVFGMAHYIPVNQGQSAFKPQSYGARYFDELPTFFALLASKGFYGFWTMFPDNAFLMPRLEEQRQTHRRMTDILRELPNSLYELTNENGAHDFNSVAASQFPRPTRMLACVSGYGDEFGADLPPAPHWDFGNYHPPRRYPAHILDCNVVNHPFVLRLNRPVLLGEPDRYGSRGNPNVDHARMSAGAAAQSAVGIVFHSAQGRDGTPEAFDDETGRSAEAFFGALRAV